MKKRPLLSTAVRGPGPGRRDAAAINGPAAEAAATSSAPASATLAAATEPMSSQIQDVRAPDTLPEIFGDAFEAATLAAYQTWQRNVDFQFRLSTYMLDINRRAFMAGRGFGG